MSVAQLEQIAENPDLIRMAAEQMQNLTLKQYESMKGMLVSGASGVLLMWCWRGGLVVIPVARSCLRPSTTSSRRAARDTSRVN